MDDAYYPSKWIWPNYSMRSSDWRAGSAHMHRETHTHTELSHCSFENFTATVWPSRKAALITPVFTLKPSWSLVFLLVFLCGLGWVDAEFAPFRLGMSWDLTKSKERGILNFQEKRVTIFSGVLRNVQTSQLARVSFCMGWLHPVLILSRATVVEAHHNTLPTAL